MGGCDDSDAYSGRTGLCLATEAVPAAPLVGIDPDRALGVSQALVDEVLRRSSTDICARTPSRCTVALGRFFQAGHACRHASMFDTVQVFPRWRFGLSLAQAMIGLFLALNAGASPHPVAVRITGIALAVLALVQAVALWRSWKQTVRDD
jgi:hypothetical protein